MKLRCRVKPYIQPFEHQLALAELTALTGDFPRKVASKHPKNGAVDTYEVLSQVSASTLIDRLAYWEYVGEEADRLTIQSLREATVNIVRNGISLERITELVPFDSEVPLPNRRCLRYGPHGIHEYRGKFFPQLVRSLLNIADVPTGGIVADPMSGSGTTAVEAVLARCHALGLDMNPLSVLMGRTKCGLLAVSPELLASTYEEVREKLLLIRPSRGDTDLPYFSTLPEQDQRYLSAWFSEQVLHDLDQVVLVIGDIIPGAIRDLLHLSLSNIIRRVSWQKDEDLRVRKEIRTDIDIDPIKEFLEELGRSIRILLAFLRQNQKESLGSYIIRDGDARNAVETWREWEGRVDVVITSPPYATALPYLDTDRLSLCYLGLLPRPEHRERDRLMIGNREITGRDRRDYWQHFDSQRGLLPNSVIQLIERIDLLNTMAEVGFRRKNLSALLAKYFLDMRQVLENIRRMLKPGAPAYIVVGNNHTIAGGERVEIETANLLADIAMQVGLYPEEHIPMDMLVSRGLFRKNAVASEVILSLRQPV